MTDNVIYYDINKSTYVYKTNYFDFYFSSQFYLNKFKINYIDYIENEQDKVKVKLGQDVNFIKIFLLEYYKKVEKRGFKVYDNLQRKYIKADYRIKGCIVSD